MSKKTLRSIKLEKGKLELKDEFELIFGEVEAHADIQGQIHSALTVPALRSHLTHPLRSSAAHVASRNGDLVTSTHCGRQSADEDMQHAHAHCGTALF